MASRSWMNSLKPGTGFSRDCAAVLLERYLLHTLSLAQGMDIIRILARETLEEAIHVEAIEHARLLLIARGGVEIFAVGVEETGEAAHECGSDLLRVEGGGTDDADLLGAPVMADDGAAGAPVHAIFGLVVADGTDRLLVVRSPLETVAFDPGRCFRVADRLHQHVGHDRRSGYCRLCVGRWSVSGGQ